MRRTIISFVLGFFTLTALYGQVYQVPGQLYGVYYMYDFGPFEKVAVPQGYKLVSINHYGRHGARYQDSKDAYTGVLEPLLEARSAGALTSLGESVCDRTEAFWELCKDHYGELTEKGWQQQQVISRNIYRAAPQSFWKGCGITATSSFSKRCIMTMSAFCLGLLRCNPKLDIYECVSPTLLDATNPGDKSNVNYVALSSEPSPWNASYSSVLKDNLSTDDAIRILSRLFNVDYLKQNLHSPRGYCSALYNMIAGMGCVGDDILIDDVFTEEELVPLFKAINYGFFEWSALRRESLKPILATILREADEDLSSGKNTVRLKFGHDVNLLGVMHMLQVEDLGIVPEKLDDLSETWHCWMTPMAANFEFFFYWNRKDSKAIVLPYLNGRVVELRGLEKVYGRFYRWEDLRERIAALSVR